MFLPAPPKKLRKNNLMLKKQKQHQIWDECFNLAVAAPICISPRRSSRISWLYNWGMLMPGANQVALLWNESGYRPWLTAQTLPARCCFVNSCCWDWEWPDTHILTPVSDLEFAGRRPFLSVCGEGCRTTSTLNKEGCEGKVGARSSLLFSNLCLGSASPISAFPWRLLRAHEEEYQMRRFGEMLLRMLSPDSQSS